ncbi:hypothetical protein NW801_12500 [Brevibacillus laterosporus]|uniref:Uncharacterized protein n=1 Tax=Brevibacillus halotolerans TaxID=1507437 RepID=A0ABT4HYL6_9BACL|nr:MULTISPECIES: hypothetical protein [Brevibacillus]MCR8985858.1 hypothetical protein [Brevibacillus laterosporus]MCZ0831591.1 hypothetical protein [Brevibacillus halotolerans]
MKKVITSLLASAMIFSIMTPTFAANVHNEKVEISPTSIKTMASTPKPFNMIWDYQLEGKYAVSSNGSITVSLSGLNTKNFNIEVKISGPKTSHKSITHNTKNRSVTFDKLPQGSYTIMLINNGSKEASIRGTANISWK